MTKENEELLRSIIRKLRKEFGIRISLKKTFDSAVNNVNLHGVNGINFLSNGNFETAHKILASMYEKNKNLILNIRKISRSEYERSDFAVIPEQIALI